MLALSQSSHSPVIFLACVNSYKKGKRLRYLVKERIGIAKLLSSSGKKQPLYQPLQQGTLSSDIFYELLEDREFQERLVVMHLVGHRDNNHLRIEAENFEVSMPIEEFSKVVAQLPNLQAVFLSGCATPRLLDTLLRRDIPAVIVTETYDKDERASAVAKTFYRQLAKGESIFSSFSLVMKSFPLMKPHRVTYNIETDELEWFRKPEAPDLERIPWGMYYLKENEVYLRRKLVDRPALFARDRYKKTARWKKTIRYLTYSATALLLGLLAVGITLYLDRPSHILAFF